MEQIGRQLKEAQALQTEILRKSRDHETLNSKGQELISTSDRDGDAVQAVLDGVNNRWTDFNDGLLIDLITHFRFTVSNRNLENVWILFAGVNDRVQNLEDILQKLHEFSDNLNDVNCNLKKYEDKLQAHNDLGPAGKDAKHLDKMRVSRFYPRTTGGVRFPGSSW